MLQKYRSLMRNISLKNLTWLPVPVFDKFSPLCEDFDRFLLNKLPNGFHDLLFEPTLVEDDLGRG
jgi:hypothetical protein